MATITEVKSYHKLVLREYLPAGLSPIQADEYYWNKNTLDFDYKYNLAFYSGSAGPIFQISEGALLSYLCDGSTSTEYRYTAVGNLKNDYTTNVVPNAELCTVPPACDLIVTGVSVTAETAAGANDGTITIMASASSGIEYTKTLGLPYQSSNVFTGLAPGSYIIFLRLVDLPTCTASTVLLTINAFGTAGGDSEPRWRLDYENRHGQNTVINLFEKDYTGVVEDVCGSPTPLVEKTERGGELNHFTPIKTSQVEVQFLSETELKYSDVFTGDPHKFRVEVKKDGVHSFIGFIVPDVYTEAYKSVPYPVSFTAVDGLQLLKLEKYEDPSVGVKTVLAVINYCLLKTGLRLNIITGFEFSVAGLDLYGTDVSDPDYESLNDVMIDTTGFVEENITYYQVLERLMMAVHCTLFQEKGKWHIIDTDLLKSTVVLREFDANLTYIGNTTYDSQLQVTCVDVSEINTFLGDQATRQFLPAYSKQQIVFERDVDDELITGGEFALEDFYHNGSYYTDIPLHWTISSGTTVKRKATDDGNKDTYAISILGNATNQSTAKYIESNQTVSYGVGFEDIYKLKFRYKVVVGNTPAQNSESLFYFELKHEGSWYDNEGNTFQTPVQIEIPVTDFGKFQDYEIETKRSGMGTGAPIIKFFQGVGKDNLIDHVEVRAVSMRFFPEGDFTKKEIEFTESAPSAFVPLVSLYVPKKRVLKLSDPATPYFGIIKNAFRLPLSMHSVISGESSMQGWKYKNESSVKSMINWQAERILNNNISAVMVISGQMFTKATMMNTFIDPRTDNKLFMIVGLTRDDFSGTVNIELLEMKDATLVTATDGLLFEDVVDNSIQFEDFKTIDC